MFLTVPSNTIPTFKSSMECTALDNFAVLKIPLGSLPGLDNSSITSFTVYGSDPTFPATSINLFSLLFLINSWALSTESIPYNETICLAISYDSGWIPVSSKGSSPFTLKKPAAFLNATGPNPLTLWSCSLFLKGPFAVLKSITDWASFDETTET